MTGDDHSSSLFIINQGKAARFRSNRPQTKHNVRSHCSLTPVDGRNPASHLMIGSSSRYLQGFLHPRWCRMSSNSSINSKTLTLFVWLTQLFSRSSVCIVTLPIFFACYHHISSHPLISFFHENRRVPKCHQAKYFLGVIALKRLGPLDFHRFLLLPKKIYMKHVHPSTSTRFQEPKYCAWKCAKT